MLGDFKIVDRSNLTRQDPLLPYLFLFLFNSPGPGLKLLLGDWPARSPAKDT